MLSPVWLQVRRADRFEHPGSLGASRMSSSSACDGEASARAFGGTSAGSCAHEGDMMHICRTT
eukprot:2599922-Prymnesium_polylepis.1